MIRSFRHKGLKELFEKGASARVQKPLQDRCFDFHALHGRPRRYTVHVNGPWCITFEFEDGDAFRVDLQQYH